MRLQTGVSAQPLKYSPTLNLHFHTSILPFFHTSNMSLIALNDTLQFPPPEMADEDGLLAIGGDLSRARLLHAYRNGIFPWYENKYILWWCPDPRFVLFPSELKISSSMKQAAEKTNF